MTTIVDIYCRVSTDDQENNTSLEGQEAEARDYCKEQGFIVGMVHKEVFTGFKYRERKKLLEMRQRYREGKIQGVVVRTLDRLSRAQAHVSILLEEMDYYGVTLYSVKEIIDNTPMGKFSRMVLAHFAEMEREKILDRTITGRVNKAKDGKIVSGRKLPYGWKWNNDTTKDFVVIDEERAAVLRQTAEEYASGSTFYAISTRLNSEGVPPAEGKVWYPDALRRVLTDSRLTGKNLKIFDKGTRGKQVKEKLQPVDLPDGTFPAIISEELYQKILERVSMNVQFSQRNAKEAETFLLRAGFLRCAVCKRAMSAIASNKHEDGYSWVQTYYKCANPHCSHAPCQVSSKKFDAIIWEAVVQLADHVTLLEESVALAMHNHTVEDDLRATEAALIDWKAKVENYEGDLADSSLRGNTRVGIRNLLNGAYEKVEELENHRAELFAFSIDVQKERVEFEKIIDWCKKAKSEREELSYTQKRVFLHILGVTVLVSRTPGNKGAAPIWDIKVPLPAIQSIIYHGTSQALESIDDEQAVTTEDLENTLFEKGSTNDDLENAGPGEVDSRSVYVRQETASPGPL